MTRIAVVLQADPTDPRAWSGIPAGVISGLEAAGVEPVAVDARMRVAELAARALRISWVGQASNPLFAASGSLRAAQRIRAAGHLDGAVKIGSGFSLEARVPTVTYEDMTVEQALRSGDPAYASLGERARRRWRSRQLRSYERCRACCAASSWAASSIEVDYGIDPARIHVVGFGHDLTVRELERDWATPRFLFLGRDWARKRGDAVVEAFAVVRERHPAASLDLVGEHPRIDAPGVTGHGYLPLGSPGARERIEDLLSRATCLVLPSAYEPFGIAYLEAAAHGIPSIGTTIGGASDAIGDGGVVIEPGDEPGLERAMLMLAEPDTARRLGALAQSRVPMFGWRTVAERLLRALRPDGVDPDGLAPFLHEAQ